MASRKSAQHTQPALALSTYSVGRAKEGPCSGVHLRPNQPTPAHTHTHNVSKREAILRGNIRHNSQALSLSERFLHHYTTRLCALFFLSSAHRTSSGGVLSLSRPGFCTFGNLSIFIQLCGGRLQWQKEATYQKNVYIWETFLVGENLCYSKSKLHSLVLYRSVLPPVAYSLPASWKRLEIWISQTPRPECICCEVGGWWQQCSLSALFLYAVQPPTPYVTMHKSFTIGTRLQFCLHQQKGAVPWEKQERKANKAEQSRAHSLRKGNRNTIRNNAVL